MREFEFLTDEVRLTHRGERHYYGASGSQGGEAGACSESIILRANGDEETVPSKLLTTMNRGDRLLLKTAGGGYGSFGSRSATATTTLPTAKSAAPRPRAFMQMTTEQVVALAPRWQPARQLRCTLKTLVRCTGNYGEVFNVRCALLPGPPSSAIRGVLRGTPFM